MSPAGEIILAAKKLIEKHGWCQLVSENGKGNICLAQALGRANSYETGNFEVYVAAQRAIEIIAREPMVRWNDTVGRTVEEVYSVLDEAVKDA